MAEYSGNNVILSDRVAGERFALLAEDGRLYLLGVPNELESNVILRDRVTEEKFALLVNGGRLCLLGASDEMEGTRLLLPDRGSGITYAVVAENGKLMIEEYTFSLSFVGNAPGVIDVDRATIADAVEVVKPAHLRFIFEPITWGHLGTVFKTWGEVAALNRTWGEIANMVIVVPREYFTKQ